MNCFACKKECVMKTEKYMDVTPCMVCARVEHPGEACAACIREEFVCNFEEREADDRRIVGTGW